MATPRNPNIKVEMKIQGEVDSSSLAEFPFGHCLRLFSLCRKPAWDGSENSIDYCTKITLQCLAGQTPEEWKRFIK